MENPSAVASVGQNPKEQHRWGHRPVFRPGASRWSPKTWVGTAITTPNSPKPSTGLHRWV